MTDVIRTVTAAPEETVLIVSSTSIIRLTMMVSVERIAMV